jgi:hypothetical protein
MNPAHTVRLHYIVDHDAWSGDLDVVSVTSVEPTPAVPIVHDTGRRVFQCDSRAADTLELKPNGHLIQVEANDGARTANVYLTREAAYELGAALFALADTLRA